MVYDCHIFVCTNDRTGSGRSFCGSEHGASLIQKFKTELKSYLADKRVRVTRSGCLGICNQGPTVMIYPQGWCLVNVQPNDVTEILTAIKNNVPIERLACKQP